MSNAKKIIGFGIVFAVLCFAAYFAYFRTNTSSATVQGEDTVFFKRDDKIWQYSNGEKKLYMNKKASTNVKYDGKNLYWYSRQNENFGYVYLIDTESNEETKIKTELDVYDLKLNGNYMILSGENHNDFTYSIVAKDINTDEEIYISYTQNEQVVFDCYNDEVYFFEPTDASKLYKYNLSSGEKTKVSDLVQNNGKEKTYLCVNDAGIFFTKTTSTENEERSDLCKLSFGSDEIVTVEENINEIVGSALGALYCIDYDLPYTVYKIGLEDASKVELVSYKTIYNAGIQGNYLVCDGQNMMAPIGFRTYIVDLTGNEIIMDWTDEDEG